MNTLVKVLVATLIVIIALIGLPILVGLIGLLWPALLILAIIIFGLIFIGTLLKSDNKEG